MSGAKRRAEVPRNVQTLGEQVSKADLLEAAYHLASLCHESGSDDEWATYVRLREEINLAREIQGRRSVPHLRITLPMKARTEDALLLVLGGGSKTMPELLQYLAPEDRDAARRELELLVANGQVKLEGGRYRRC